MLGSLSEKKALIYFASGVDTHRLDNQAQLRSTINAAIRTNVAFYPDRRARPGGHPPRWATPRRAPPAAAACTPAARSAPRRRASRTSRIRSYTLAADTGGKALLEHNDLSLGIRAGAEGHLQLLHPGLLQQQREARRQYRRIKVQMASNPAARKLDYRSGYFASKEFRQFTSTDKERQLQEALMLGDPVTDLSLALEVNYFRLARDRYFVPVAVKIPGTEIELAKRGGAETTEIRFHRPGARTPTATLQGTVRDDITVKLKGETAGQLAKRNLQYDTGFTLPPGAVHPEVPGARERDRQDGDLRDEVHRAGPRRADRGACRSAPWC